MFRQSLRRCARIGGASFATPSLRTTRPVTLKSIAQSSQSTLRAPVSINAFRRYSSEAAAAVAADPAAKTQEPSGPTTRFADLRKLGVHSSLVSTITDGMKYETMSEVQSKTIEPALKGMDLVAQAKTGTGKTLAFLIPLLQRMLAADPSLATRRARFSADSTDIRGIIISPTRELAEQIAVEAGKLCANTGLVVQCAVGGTRRNEMLRKTQREGCHLLVGTPGRLNDLLSDPHSGISAPNLAAIVLDEADRMLDVGFERELQDIVSQLPDPHTSQRQTLLFSATIPKNVIALARQWVRADNFDFIQTVSADEVLTHEKVPQHVVKCRGWANLIPTFYELMEKEVEKRRNNPEMMPFKALVFLPTSAFVDLVADVDQKMRFNRDRIMGWRIHAKLTQAQRTTASNKFRDARSGILFSTDVTARGLDFPNVTHVIQIGCPSDRQQYIHRLGRTGRADKEGEGWLLMPESETGLARSELAGLPIKAITDIEAAEFDFTGQELPSELTTKVTEATSQLREQTLNAAYLSLFGQRVGDVQKKADELKEWFVHAMKMDNTPAISASIAQTRGLRNIRGINISGRGSSFGRDGTGRGRFDDRESRGGFSNRGGFRRDPFERMEREGSDRYSRGGSRRTGRSDRDFERASF
ncbi:DEAD/DEAH box helicase [Colletotrichum graminicola]|uniref:ATP-dependent RNA helicase n=1 Tax=Colletotrichum graminicola (strain M1.001 / M2 / FGSC 10212) TaxID=645133 RepID=E3QA79_COLGM|nr:DEAD/DEAH box helicase [Colletotrichum graminicola M1.001]EFQ27767.1 DEAD/DEAH box helicase [Colletotrichum graminicola M1.001]WDK11540.1 DEAD/DEAH box helicase [Colletotrichum graminicola]